jgi:hypothetical protein
VPTHSDDAQTFQTYPRRCRLSGFEPACGGSGLFAILIGNIIRHRTEMARIEAPSQAQLLAELRESDAEAK